jgi:hypothetical protein
MPVNPIYGARMRCGHCETEGEVPIPFDRKTTFWTPTQIGDKLVQLCPVCRLQWEREDDSRWEAEVVEEDFGYGELEG